MKLHQSQILVTVIFLFFGLNLAATAANTESQQLVEVQVPVDVLASYKQRRGDSGFYLTLSAENFNPTQLVSLIDGSPFSGTFGKGPLALTTFEIERKYNFTLGSIALGLTYGKGSLASRSTGLLRTIDFSRQGLTLKYTVDNFLEEPFVAPYVGYGFTQYQITDTSPSASQTVLTQFSGNLVVGMLLQLDWLDFATAKESTVKWGIQNTFIDVFLKKQLRSQKSTDPNVETDFLTGAGLTLEF